MPRISRKNLIGQYFHLMSQGINKERIFLNNKWKDKYKELLKQYSIEYEINIIAYCIMDNHVHLLVCAEKEINLSKFMHRINTIYASFYNRTNNRVGYVFRNRYQIQTIKDEGHLKNCIAYIHNNPVKAKIASKCSNYKYSSFNEYLKKEEIVSLKYLTKIFECNDAKKLRNFILKINKYEKEGEFLEIKEEINYNKVVKEFKKQNITKDKIIYELKNRYNLSERKISKCLNISRYQVKKNVENYNFNQKGPSPMVEKEDVMNYKDLANVIYPDVKDIEFYEKKYEPRNIPEGAEVTRFAPSPTGFVHIGGLYQCIINRALAKQTGGVFYLRIEDTDQKRKIENGVEQIIQAIANFDFIPDEGMISENKEKGNYGPYKQSERKEIYHAFAKYLIEQGRAYPCFATPEEIEEIRKKQEAAGLRTGFYGIWAKYRNLPVDEAIEKIKNGESFVIRLRSTGREDRKIKVKDSVRGHIEFPENDQDAVLIKADGLPVYHFAHVVDDHLMKTTTVVRGEEWISSTPLHIELFNAFGFKAPKYAQVPNILKEEDGKKRKISKRKDPEAAVDYYHEEGIPSDAVCEYLMNIINSSFEGWRRANPNNDMSDFKLELSKMGVSGAVFDMVKLLDVSKNIIARYTANEVYDYVKVWADKYDEELAKLIENKEYAIKVFGIERDNQKKPRKDLSKWSDVKDNIIYMYKRPTSYDFDKITGSDAKRVIEEYINVYDYSDDKQVWFDKIKGVAERLGYAREVKEYKQNPEAFPGHVGDVSTVIRLALTGRRNTPDMYEIMQVLGKEEVKERLQNFLNI